MEQFTTARNITASPSTNALEEDSVIVSVFTFTPLMVVLSSSSKNPPASFSDLSSIDNVLPGWLNVSSNEVGSIDPYLSLIVKVEGFVIECASLLTISFVYLSVSKPNKKPPERKYPKFVDELLLDTLIIGPEIVLDTWKVSVCLFLM